MKVIVRHFAALRERRGASEETLDRPAGITVGALYTELFPPSSAGVMPALFAVNREYAPRDQVLVDGDEVAFIPPLGGG